MSIQQLQQEKEQLMQRIAKLDSAIKALQEVCSHTHDDGSTALAHDWSDSHNDYYVCKLCGKTF